MGKTIEVQGQPLMVDEIEPGIYIVECPECGEIGEIKREGPRQFRICLDRPKWGLYGTMNDALEVLWELHRDGPRSWKDLRLVLGIIAGLIAVAAITLFIGGRS